MERKDLFFVADQWGPESAGTGVYAYEVAPHLPALRRGDGLTVAVAVRSDAPRLADEVRQAGGDVGTLLTLDLLIILKTIKTIVLGGKRAY